MRRRGKSRRHSSGLFNWMSAISAIIQREIRTRFAGGSFGYGWAIILPVSWVLAIIVFFVWVGRQSPVAVPLPVFIASGMIPYLIFRQVVTTLMRVVRANRHLITLGPSQEEDLLTAGAILELFNTILVCGVVGIILAVWVGFPMPPDPLTAMVGVAMAWALGASTGRFAASLAHYSDTAQRLVPILLRPFFWISGIFFIAAELPRSAQDILFFNPLLHIIEYTRSGLLPGFDSDFANPLVPMVAIFGFYFSSRILDATRLPQQTAGGHI